MSDAATTTQPETKAAEVAAPATNGAAPDATKASQETSEPQAGEKRKVDVTADVKEQHDAPTEKKVKTDDVATPEEVPASEKGKGKGKAAASEPEPTAEDEEDEDEDSDVELPPRRARAARIDYSSSKAYENAGLKPGEVDPDDEDEDAAVSPEEDEGEEGEEEEDDEEDEDDDEEK